MIAQLLHEGGVMIQPLLAKVVEGKNLSLAESRAVAESIFRGQATPAQIAGLLVALRLKGETADELAGFAQAMRGAATPVVTPPGRVIADTCGTGGDGQGTFNISTGAALVAAGAGVLVAKHGNRSVSSRCGSADVLEELGVKVDAVPFVAEKCLAEAGIAFLFAPTFHPAMRHAGPVRRELGLRTLFNLLGPLTNPAHAQAQVIGVYAPDLVDVMACVLVRLGVREALVVHTAGHDEITLTGPARAVEIAGGKPRRFLLQTADFGFPRNTVKSLRGGDRAANADILRRILDGAKGPRRNAVVANAAAVIRLAARAAGEKTMPWKDARKRAEAALDSGAAKAALARLVDLSHSLTASHQPAV
jgi:anthranilate phosphoribosyltransferase